MGGVVEVGRNPAAGAFYILAGVGSLAYLAWATWQGGVCRSWPTVTGRILAAEPRRGGSLRNRWIVAVVYEYAVDGTTYQGTRIQYGYTGHVTRGAAENY